MTRPKPTRIDREVVQELSSCPGCHHDLGPHSYLGPLSLATADNNHAERAIRPHVILRNRSFHNRIEAGAHAHSVLTSLVQTLLLQKRTVIAAIASAYLARRHGSLNSSLFTSDG